MARDEYLFTSESVTEGHPDKIADQISDAVLDAIISQDPTGRVACECLLTTGLVVVAGEITTSCYVDIPRIARDTIRGVGYTRAKFGFDYETCGIITAIDEQSSDIAMAVDALGAGDQGLMFGYACTETPELMPLPIMLAHRLVMRLAEVRRNGILDYLRPDGKSQVTVRYVDGQPRAVETVVVSCQHSPDVTTERIRAEVVEHVIVPTMPLEILDPKACVFHVNPTGRFVTGGPMGDTGLTGRKIIVDTYGGSCPHGGGAFSGKDPTKVDRSACYMARHVAKNIVAAGLAARPEVQGAPAREAVDSRVRGGFGLESRTKGRSAAWLSTTSRTSRRPPRGGSRSNGPSSRCRSCGRCVSASPRNSRSRAFASVRVCTSPRRPRCSC